jgi:hypothetical protein
LHNEQDKTFLFVCNHQKMDIKPIAIEQIAIGQIAIGEFV